MVKMELIQDVQQISKTIRLLRRKRDKKFALCIIL